MLRLPDVPGLPTLAEAASPWQRDLVRAIFGSYDRAANTRHIREFFCMVPKKSSKTTTGAAIMLVALLRNKRPRAEFLMVAPSLKIADLAFSQMVGMIDADPLLKTMCHHQGHLRRVEYRPTKAFLTIKTFDPDIVTGAKPSGVLLDELHVMSEKKDADRVIGQLRGGLLPNPEGFMITITTQSERPPAGVFKAALDTARKIRNGEVNLPTLPLLYEFPDGVDWRNPDNWHMVMPSLGRPVTVERLLPEYAEAKETGEEEIRRWVSQHLNVQVGLGLKSDRWAGADFWEAAAEPGLTLQGILDRSEVVCIGVDGGGLDDLLAISVLGREKVTRRWLHWGRAWAHNFVLERRKSEAPRLRDLEKTGDLEIVDEMEAAFLAVADIAAQVDAAGLLHAVGLDPMGVGAIVDALALRGIEGDDRVVGVSQGWTLTGAVKTGEVKLADGSFAHCGQELMAWAVANCKVEPRGNAVVITKQSAGNAKIDPAMSMFDSIQLMSRNPEAMGPSAYENRELLVL